MKLNRTQVIRLATKSKTGMLWETTSGQLMHTHTSGIFRETYTPFHLYFVNDEEIKEGDGVYHNDGFVFQCKGSDGTHLSMGDGFPLAVSCKKIIATTDGSLTSNKSHFSNKTESIELHTERLPQPSQSFIEEYCKQGGIDEVMVEYESCIYCGQDCYLGEGCDEYNSSDYTPHLKVNSHNQITIHAIKDSWSRDEVEQLILRSHLARGKMTNLLDEIPEWIDNNL